MLNHNPHIFCRKLQNVGCKKLIRLTEETIIIRAGSHNKWSETRDDEAQHHAFVTEWVWGGRVLLNLQNFVTANIANLTCESVKLSLLN